MIKNFVLDTNVLLTDGVALRKFGKAKVNIPFVVLQELDKHKSDPGDVGLNARIVANLLDELSLEGDLVKGVETPEGSVIRILLGSDLGQEKIPDEQIIDAAIALGSLEEDPVEIVSNDTNLRIKARLKGLIANAHGGHHVHVDDDKIYTGISDMIVEEHYVDGLHGYHEIHLPEAEGLNINSFVHLRSDIKETHTAIGRVKEGGQVEKIVSYKNIFGIKPKNLEQVCAMNLLMDKEVKLVTLMGKAGSGKTILGLAAALEQVINEGSYGKVVIIRSPTPTGKDIGFVPGTAFEKTLVWMGAILDNLEVLLGDNTKFNFQHLVDMGKIEIMPPTFMRGKSMGNSIILLEEGQVLTNHEMKTIVTRVAETSKLIITGDVRQIDNPRLSLMDNGLTNIVEKFKPYSLAGHVTLMKGERGTLASLAADIM